MSSTAPAATRARSRRPRPSDVDHVVASIAVTLLTVVTSVAMCRVFADWAFLDTLLVTGITLHVVSILLRIARVPGWLAIPVVAATLFELIALLFYRPTMRGGILPSGETIELLRIDLRLVWSQFPTAVAPVPSEGAFLLAAVVGIGLVAILADAFAFRAYGRAEAIVPGGVLFVFTAALGTDRYRIGVAAAWFAAALVVVAVLRALHGGGSESWLGRRRRAVGAALPATAMCALVAALGAAVVGPLLPGAGAEPLLETRQTQSDVTEVLSPLVDIRSRLVNRANTEMFTVSASAGRYWRATGLTEFDGTTWQLPERSLDDADGRLNDRRDDAEIVQQQITISRLGGELLPVAFTPIEVAQSDLLWLAETDTLILDDARLAPGMTFNVESDISVPSPDALRSTSASNAPGDFLSLPSGIPDEAVQLAVEVTAGQPTDYDRARALQDWFQTEFEYSLEVQRGHSDDAISAFLRARIGYCEQFAGTFAVMARSLGLPARVAVGFTQGELRADGRFHVLGKHAHAWPEVWFDGVGWVLFEPTPGRGAPGSESVTGRPAEQDSSPTETGTGEPQVPAPTTTAAAVTPTTERDPTARPTPTPTTQPPVTLADTDGGGGGPFGWILLAAMAVGAWAVGMPWLVRRITRTGSTPTEQVISAWHGTVGALELAGASPPGGATPVEYARRVEHELAVDHRSLVELARFVTRAIYSPSGVGEPAALRAAVLRTHLDRSSRELMPWYRRAWARLDPRLVRQRLVGDRPRRPR